MIQINDILALEIDDGIERDLLLENSESVEELHDLETNEWAKLEEIDFNDEIAYIDKALEFASAMEEVELKDNAVRNELDNSKNVESKSDSDKTTEVDEQTQVEYYKKLFGNNYLVFRPDENYTDKIVQARFGTELWKYLILLVLLLALVEMFIARSTKKDIASLN